jgi:hypothetical protein
MWVAKRVSTSGARSRAETALATETDEARDEKSRLKAGCSQDWLPHNDLIYRIARSFAIAVSTYTEDS